MNKKHINGFIFLSTVQLLPLSLDASQPGNQQQDNSFTRKMSQSNIL